ncbi:DUF2141 domain-containing protein [Lewinella sp. IMCC34183]|uniref:DUF2141 domain-containing protein n=1 Tax=Lewinella sp. IMCC34183 TaxID=2248762 RepID=UPI00130091C4|nr:DUF2141 domain-containing protein [Lewinella sp. IMCC34183]
MKAILGLLLLLVCDPLSAQDELTFTLEVSNLRNEDGSVLVSVFRDQRGFKAGDPVETIRIPKRGKLKNGRLTSEISLPAGTYGLALVDDEDDNGDMDYNWLGMPKEGFGFSDYYLSGLSRPVFSDFSFELKAGKKVVETKFRYL